MRPLFAEYPTYPFFTPDMVDTVMYGDNIKVDFVFTPNDVMKTVFLPPGSLWLELFAFDLFLAKNGGNNVTI